MIAVMGNDGNDGVSVVWGVALGESVWHLPFPRPHPGPLPLLTGVLGERGNVLGGECPAAGFRYNPLMGFHLKEHIEFRRGERSSVLL